jgi:poly(3-hydroxybutyrate) depolymerase
MMRLLPIAGLAATAMAASAVYSAGDTSGCGKTHIFNGITQYRTIQSSGGDRSFGVHLPVDYDADHQYPTILGFHGSDSIGFFFEADTRLSFSQYTGDKIVVYPNGLGGAWAGANYSEATVAQDTQFVWDLLADLRANFCVDSARIYATGMSIGGGFVDTLACNDTVGGEFAAFAPASGSFYTNNDANYADCSPARVPVPILEIHGGADADVVYAGGEGQGGDNPAIADWCVGHGHQVYQPVHGMT